MRVPTQISVLLPSGTQLGLTGSQFFGSAEPSSDWDVYAQWTPALEAVVKRNFTKSNTYPLDDNTVCTFHKRIDATTEYNIILVKDFNKRKKLDDLLKRSCPAFCKSFKHHHGVLALKQVINLLYKTLGYIDEPAFQPPPQTNNSFAHITISDWDMPF